MKMTCIEVMLIKTPPPCSGGDVWYTVKINTDEGIYGLGESMPHFAFATMEKSYRKLAEDVFGRFYIGKDPFDRELLYGECYRALCAAHPDIMGMSIISAFDLAMWDICGKAANMSVYQLLGGKLRDRLRSYSYISYEAETEKTREKGRYGNIWHDPAALCNRAVQMAGEGFTALKYDPLEYVSALGQKPPRPRTLTAEDYRVTEKVLDALKKTLGDRCEIIIGTHGQMTTASAIQYAKLLENYSPMWFEEPIPPGNLKEMAKVQRSTSVPVAAGERLITIFEYLQALEEGAVSVIQPDVGICGGITQAKKAAAIAESFFVDVAPHLWGGPVLSAAAVQLSLAIPNFMIQENIIKAQGFHKRITKDFYKWEQGYIYPSAAPGLGVTLDEELIKETQLE